jgi:heme-degrading monooxygenase HmoA
VWVVKKGHEAEFARIWQATADDAALAYPGVTFRLLRDVENPSRFVAFSGAWTNAEQIAAARARPSFQEAMGRAHGVIESVELSTFELAAEVS